MAASNERKFLRFNLSYPVHVKFFSGNSIAEVDAVSKNISIGGFLVESTCLIPNRTPVEFMITIGGPIPKVIKLRGAGEVVRIEPGEKTYTFAIAVACAKPLSHIENYLSAANGQ